MDAAITNPLDEIDAKIGEMHVKSDMVTAGLERIPVRTADVDLRINRVVLVLERKVGEKN